MSHWVAFYIKRLRKHNSFAIEVHGWECEGKSSEEALSRLEKNPAVPYRLFLAKVVPLNQKDSWLEEGEQEAKRLGLIPPKVVLHGCTNR